jgi:tripartite ATP-independent transporter DctM subunit
VSWWATLLSVFGLLLLLFATGLPIFACFMLINVVAVLMLMGVAGLGLFVNSMLETTTTEALVAIPLYVLLGELLFRAGGVSVLYQSLNQLIGAIRGRLYVIAITLAGILGAISGSAMASVAMLGRFVYPTMIERGCDRRLSIGMILAGATLDPIIPPSILAVILATLANLSVAEFLVAGILPGIVLAGSFAGYAVIRTIINPALDSPVRRDPDAKNDWRSTLWSAVQMLPLVVIIFLVLGLILAGVAQPTEAAAVGIVGSVLMSVLYRKFSLAMLYEACMGAAYTTSTILIIIASSKLFSQLLAFTGATAGLIDFTSQLALNRWLLFFIMMAAVFFFCKFMDQLALMLIAVPVYSPLIVHLGFDPIWFWMLFLINITLGGITPPFGYTMFVFKSVRAEVSMVEIYWSAAPIVGVALLAMLLMSVFPQIVTWLPASLR